MSRNTIALVTSTISPTTKELYGADPALFTPEVRLEQTKETIGCLIGLGYEQIYVADNSGSNWLPILQQELSPAKILSLESRPSLNKGISELYLLRAALTVLPAGFPIVKLSGRYNINRRLEDYLGSEQFVFRIHGRQRRYGSYRQGMRYRHVSTVALAARCAICFAQLVDLSLRELFGYPARIVGPRSLARIIRNSLQPGRDLYPYHDPPISMELAMCRALKLGQFTVHSLNELGVEGISGQDGRVHKE